MLPTLQRRHTRHRRWLASATAFALALGIAAGGTAPALAAKPSETLSTPIVDEGGVTTYEQRGLVCNATSIGFQKPAALDGANLDKDGMYTAAWGTISWDVDKRMVSWAIVDGWDIDVCVKGGTALSVIDTSKTETSSYTHTYAGLSHLGFRINASKTGNDLDCVTATNVQGRTLTNGDHINMDIVQGDKKFQINAQIDKRQAQDPESESGLVVRISTPDGKHTLPLSNAQRDSGVFTFEYSTYLTGQWTVEWVQFTSTYFNKDRDKAAFLNCGDLPTETLVTPTSSFAQLGCTSAGSYTLDAVEGVRWFIGETEVKPGTYAVASAVTIVVRAEAESPEYGIDPEAKSEFTFVFTEPADCVLPCLPVSAVSYTYYNLSNDTLANPANSGLITVTARDGYSDELCKPFWVVAAAWNYSSSTSIWPQTLRSTDPAGDHPQGYIDSVGTYFFHAPVECGQGDIYASFTGVPYIGPELFGPNNPFTERFLHGMGFTGPRPTWLNTQPGCNVVNPIAPTASPIAECGTYGSITTNAVANPYVGFTVYQGRAAANGSVAGLETVPVNHATEGIFTVVATALNGHIFAPGTIRQWEFDLGEYGDCPVDIDLRLTYMEECAPDPSYTFRVKNLSDVSVPFTYTVAGNAALNGSGIAAPGDTFFDLAVDRTNPVQSYTVTLRWGDGTSIVSEATTKASGRDKVCELAVEPVVDIACAAAGRYTVPTVLGVTWLINGVGVEPGTYTVADESTIVLRAAAVNGYVLYGAGQLSSTRDFTLEFTRPASCLEPAFEGATFVTSQCDNNTPWINYSVLVSDPDGLLTSTVARLIFAYPGDATRNYELVLGDVTPGVALSGRILWPGASVDPVTNEPTGWPGWAQDSAGNWVETAADENFAWTRTLTEVTVKVEPETQISVSYPQPSSNCGSGPITVEPLPAKTTCATGGSGIVLPDVEGVLWFVDGVKAPASSTPLEVLTPGEYWVTAGIDPDTPGGPFAFAQGTTTSWTFAFTSDDICEIGQETFTTASIGFIDPTCSQSERLDPTKLVVGDDTLARLDRYEEFADGSYEVVFVTIDPDARFVDDVTLTPGRTVSEGGTVLTFTGELRGPDLTGDCLPTLSLTEEAVTFATANCLDATNWLILSNTEGVQWWVDGKPMTGGTWALSDAGGLVVVQATPIDGYGFGLETATRWEHTYPASQDACALPSLAQTGASSALVGLGLVGMIMTLIGAGFIIRHRYQQA